MSKLPLESLTSMTQTGFEHHTSQSGEASEVHGARGEDREGKALDLAGREILENRERTGD